MQVLLRRHPGLRSLPHVDLGVRRTPVEERKIDGVRLLVKRDDLTSALYGGNKVRPLEFLLARPGDRVLTFTALGAHHAYATAVHAETVGKRTIAVVLRKGTPGPMLDRLPSVCEDVVIVGGPVRAALAGVEERQAPARGHVLARSSHVAERVQHVVDSVGITTVALEHDAHGLHVAFDSGVLVHRLGDEVPGGFLTGAKQLALL